MSFIMLLLPTVLVTDIKVSALCERTYFDVSVAEVPDRGSRAAGTWRNGEIDASCILFILMLSNVNLQMEDKK